MDQQDDFVIEQEGDAFTVCRKGTVLRTPAGFPLSVSTEALALAITAEFRKQGSKRDLRKMPCTQMALTAIDISSSRGGEVVDTLMRYGENELICQRAEEPAELVAEQIKVWQPYLDWCAATFNAELRTGSGIVPFEQDADALGRLRTYLETLDAFTLTGLSEACHALGSLVLGLALLRGRADSEQALNASELEILWQNKKWGEDASIQSRYADIRRELDLCVRWFAFLK